MGAAESRRWKGWFDFKACMGRPKQRASRFTLTNGARFFHSGACCLLVSYSARHPSFQQRSISLCLTSERFLSVFLQIHVGGAETLVAEPSLSLLL